MLRITRMIIDKLRGRGAHHLVVLSSTALHEQAGGFHRITYVFHVKHRELSEPFIIGFDVDPEAQDTQDFATTLVEHLGGMVGWPEG